CNPQCAASFKWKTTFRSPVTEYDRDMSSVHSDSDLVRLRQFLKTLEAEARMEIGGIDPNAREIEILKREIAYLEGVQRGGADERSKKLLLQIAIDYGASQRAA
ncbi:MAG: hypothetical protein WBL43_01750, partial [Pseudolabrys sp.]